MLLVNSVELPKVEASYKRRLIMTYVCYFAVKRNDASSFFYWVAIKQYFIFD